METPGCYFPRINGGIQEELWVHSFVLYVCLSTLCFIFVPRHIELQFRIWCSDDEYNQNRANVRNTLQMIEDALNCSRGGMRGVLANVDLQIFQPPVDILLQYFAKKMCTLWFSNKHHCNAHSKSVTKLSWTLLYY
jgi:hypothetical protein